MNHLTLFGLFAVTAILVTYVRKPQPLVHSGIQRGVRVGIDIRLPAGRVAIRNCGRNLVGSSTAALHTERAYVYPSPMLASIQLRQ